MVRLLRTVKEKVTQGIHQPQPDTTITDVFLTVHGVRHRALNRRRWGDWQQLLLEWMVQYHGATVRVVNFRYWYVPAILSWLVSIFRLADRWSRRYLKYLNIVCEQFPNARIHLVGHSRGTDIIHYACEQDPDIVVDSIHLMAGVVSSHVENTVFERMLSTGQVRRVVSYFSKKDLVVKFAPPPYGHLGYWGFIHSPQDLEVARFQPYPHFSLYNLEFCVGHCGYWLGEDHHVTFTWLYQMATLPKASLYEEVKPLQTRGTGTAPLFLKVD